MLDSLVGARTPVALVGFSFGALVATHLAHNLLMHMLRDDASADDLALRIHTDACLRATRRKTCRSRAAALRHRHGKIAFA